jgi:uncharacterized membrane protein
VEDRAMSTTIAAAPSVMVGSGDRQLRGSRNAYIALALGLVFFIFTIWYQVYADTRKPAESCADPFLQSHRQWRLRTAFLFMMWSILAGFCMPFGFALLVFVPVYLWFVYRLLKGLIFFSLRKVI